MLNDKTPRSTTLGVRLQSEVKLAVAAAAKKEGRSMAQWVERLILAALAKEDQTSLEA